MAVSKRVGPDFIFLAKKNSQKSKDLEHSKDVQIMFHNSGLKGWVSIAGTAVTVSDRDPRIKELYSKGLRAWFGDLGDGKHDGGPKDPKLALIEVKSRYVAYWKATVGTLGFVREVGVAGVMGQVANKGRRGNCWGVNWSRRGMEGLVSLENIGSNVAISDTTGT